MSAVLAATLLAHSATAQIAPVTNPSDAPAGVPLAPPAPGGFVVDGGGQGQWAFMMGPTGSPTMQLRLIRANPDKSGAIGFMCSRADGGMQLAIVLPGAPFVVGKAESLNLAVGESANKLHVVVAQKPPAGAPPVFEASGLAVASILKAMGEVPVDRTDERLVISDSENHKVSFSLTVPRTVASEASEICSGWGLAAVAQAKAAAGDEQIVPPPVLAPPAASRVHSGG